MHGYDGVTTADMLLFRKYHWWTNWILVDEGELLLHEGWTYSYNWAGKFFLCSIWFTSNTRDI